MQIVPSQFNEMANGDIRPISYGVKISFRKEFDDNVTFFTLDQSQLDGVDILGASNDNPIQAWEYYKYIDYTERLLNVSITRQLNFPYSVVSAIADFQLNNYDGFFVPNPAPIPVPPEITNQSTNPSYELGSSTVEVRRNNVPNPSFRDANLTSWSINAGIINPVYAASAAPSGYQVGFTASGSVAADTTLAFFTAAGVTPITTGTLTGYVFHNNASALNFYLRLDSNSSTAVSVPPNTWTRLSFTRAVSSSLSMGIRNGTILPNGVNVYFSSFMFEEHGIVLPYFDGVYNTWQSPDLTPSWTGAANDSPSILTGVPPVGIEASGTMPPIWLSTDSPNHGLKFARMMIKTAGVVAVSARDTTGVLTGSQVSGYMAVRPSVATTPTRRWVQQSDFTNTTFGTQALTPNVWNVIQDTRTLSLTNPGLSLIWSSSEPAPGSFVDIDNHMVVLGSYTGDYRDGSSSGWRWDGIPNASNSTGIDPTWVSPPVPFGSYIRPKRPVRLLQGFSNTLLSQFVGLTQGMPEIDREAGTASFTAMDFLTWIYDMPIRDTIAMANVRTDEVLANIFDQFGLDNSQYDLAKGRNVIPFLFFERDQVKAGDVIRKLMEAEMGILWLDEEGIIRFRPRLEQPSSSVYSFDEDSILSLTTDQDDEIINHVTITANVREVQDWQTLPPKTNSDTALNVIPAGGTNVFSYQLSDPCLVIEQPTLGENSSVSWFTAALPNGTNVPSGVSVVSVELKTNSYDITFSNSNGFAVNINQLSLWGRPAREISVEPAVYDAYEDMSVAQYEERILSIDNNFIQSISQAESLALTILDEYSGYNDILSLEVKGNPALQLSDIIDIDYPDYSGSYRIIEVMNSTQPSVFMQTLKVKRYTYREWFTLDQSLLNDTEVLAP